MSQPIRPTPRRIPTVVRNNLMNYGLTIDQTTRGRVGLRPFAESAFDAPGERPMSTEEHRWFWNKHRGRGPNLISKLSEPRGIHKRKRRHLKGIGIMDVVRYLREVFLDVPMRKANKAVNHVLSVREGAQGWATMPRGYMWPLGSNS